MVSAPSGHGKDFIMVNLSILALFLSGNAVWGFDCSEGKLGKTELRWFPSSSSRRYTQV